MVGFTWYNYMIKIESVSEFALLHYFLCVCLHNIIMISYASLRKKIR